MPLQISWPSPLAAAALAFLSLAAYIFYQTLLHPLARYPGPFCAKLTYAYELWFAYTGDRHLWFAQLHEKYGPIVRYGPNELSFNSPSALRTIYSHSSDAAISKAPFYNPFASSGLSIQNVRDKTIHARKKKVMSAAFSVSALREMEAFVVDKVDQFCAAMVAGNDSQEWSEPVDMNHWFGYLSVDILGEMCYGRSFGMLNSEENRWVVHTMSQAAKFTLLRAVMPIMSNVRLASLIMPGISSIRRRFVSYSMAQLNARTALEYEKEKTSSDGEKHAVRHDFCHYMMNSRHGAASFSPAEMRGECVLLLIAGSDTTAATLSATMFYLVRHPAQLSIVAAELRSTFSSVSDIRSGTALSSCVRLRACVDEAMRLSPAVGSVLPRQVDTDNFIVDGHHIPRGSVIGVPSYALHHNPAAHVRPYSFIPERWLAGAFNPALGRPTTAEDVAQTSAACAPFSIGPRGCIGKSVAYMEIMTALGRLLWLYDVRQAVGVEDPGEGRDVYGEGRRRAGEYQQYDCFAATNKGGPMVQFRKREV
ncbi:hypothetical protein TD95_000748, partial [Thielaviopsis punctulata]